MIITVLEVQNILGITGQADEIEKMIPLAESYAFSFTKNYFHTATILTSANFHNNKVEIESNDFVFAKDNFIHIVNTTFNNGVYQITDVTDSVLTLTPAIQAEEKADAIIYVCKFPTGYKIALAKLIGSLVDSGGVSAGLTSEKIGDYSYTVSSASDLLYEYFNPYKKIVVV